MIRTASRPCALLLVLLLAQPACLVQPPPPDDAGHESWVRAATQEVLGRQVRNGDELLALTAVADVSGRQAVLDYLMNRPEYADYWTQGLVDVLRVIRGDGDRSQNSGCWDEPDPDLQGWSAALVDYVGVQDPNSEWLTGPNSLMGTSFSMADVVWASVVEDKIDTIYRPHMYTLATHGGAPADDAGYRGGAARLFMDAYLDRSPDCIACHTSTFSRSGPQTGWSRHMPIPVDLEGSVFDGGTADDIQYGGLGRGDAIANLAGFFRTDELADRFTSPPVSPWGLDSSCIEHEGNVNAWNGYVSLSPTTINPIEIESSFGGSGQSDQARLADLLGRFDEGRSGLAAAGATADVFDMLPAQSPLSSLGDAATGREIMATSTCDDCHTGVGAPSFTDITSYYSEGAILSHLRDQPAVGNGSMVGQIEDEQDALDVLAAVIDGAAPRPGLCNNAGSPAVVLCEPGRADPADAFAFMVATQFVDRVVGEVYGARLTVVNHFPRVIDQEETLRVLTERFVASNWSLKALLSELLLSDMFNRRVPIDGYDLPMLANPWVADPGSTDPSLNANSEGDLATRRSVPALLNAVHDALGWPAPTNFPTDAYPGAELQQNLGRPLDDDWTGFDSVSLQSLWHWERGPGSCEKPTVNAGWAIEAGLNVLLVEAPGDLAPELWNDWVDLVLAEASTQSWSVEQLATTLKSRLLMDTSISAAERDGILAVYAQEGSAASAWSDSMDTSAETEAATRRVCSSMLRSPQFMLRALQETGPATAEVSPVCLPGEPCTYEEVCADITARSALGLDAGCVPVDLSFEATLHHRETGSVTSTVLRFDTTITNDGRSAETILRMHVGTSPPVDISLSIPAGGTVGVNMPVTIPLDPSTGLPTGPTSVWWIVDPDEELDEVDRTDNGAVLVIDAAWWKPDYRIEDIDVVDSTTLGASDVSFAVVNRGPVVGSGPTTVLDADGATQFLPPLLPGDGAPFTATAIPDCTAGNWELVADDGGLIDESNESNNSVVVLNGCDF